MYKNLHETNKLIDRLEKYARNNLYGFTIEFKNDKINKVKPSKNKRYSVGCNKMLMEISLKGKKIYLQNFKLLEYNHYIGGWFNKEQKVFQIELILLCDNYIKSINTGKCHKQYSIYDLILQKEIVLRENYIKECKNNNKRLYSIKDKYSIMYVANRHSNDPSLIWVSGTTKNDLKKMGITVYCIAKKAYEYYYQINKKDLPENLKVNIKEV